MIALEVDDSTIPAIGFGTWRLWGDECREIVESALDMGYRHIDTAQRYENEESVGRAIQESRIPRDEIFLTTKLDIGNTNAQAVRSTTEESLERLSTGHVDLLMIHWPEPDIEVEETLEAMQELQEEGLTRHLGVCNFPPSLLERAARTARIITNQVEYHPYLPQDRLIEACRSQGMFLTAYAPLARGRVLEDPLLQEIGAAHGKSPAQVSLRWLVQQGDVAAIPKSANPDRALANLSIFDFELSESEMRQIAGLADSTRVVNPPHAPDWEA